MSTKCIKCIAQHLWENTKNSQVRRPEKMPKTCRSTVAEKYQKLAGRQSRKMPKTRRSASPKNSKNSKFRTHRNMTMNFEVHSVNKIHKKHTSTFMRKCLINCRSAVTEKCQKLAGLRSRKNSKNSQVHGHKNMPRNFQVCSHKKMQKMHMAALTRKCPKTRNSAVTEKCLNLARSHSRKNPKKPQVCSHKNMPINFLDYHHKEMKKNA